MTVEHYSGQAHCVSETHLNFSWYAWELRKRQWWACKAQRKSFEHMVWLGGGRYWTQLLKSRRGMMLSGTLRRSCWNYIRSFLHGLDGFSHYWPCCFSFNFWQQWFVSCTGCVLWASAVGVTYSEIAGILNLESNLIFIGWNSGGVWVEQIFLDMAVLVEAQGELLDNIETQVCMCFSQKQFFATSECRCYTSLCNMYLQGIPVN
jgi:hypothetical protein